MEILENGNQNLPQFITNVLTARADINGMFLVPLTIERENVILPLSLFLSFVTNNKGSWQPMGMTYNPSPGINTLEIAVYYIVPKESNFEKDIKDFINEIKRIQDGKTTNQKN